MRSFSPTRLDLETHEECVPLSWLDPNNRFSLLGVRAFDRTFMKGPASLTDMQTEFEVFRKDRAKVAAVIRTALTICKRWNLTETETNKVLGCSASDVFLAPELTEEQVLRLGFILGIHRCLRTLLPDPDVADSWIHRDNRHSLFQGRPARFRLVSGRVADLEVIHNYLRVQVGQCCRVDGTSGGIKSDGQIENPP